MENCYELNTCLACGSDQLELTLSLGNQPLANNFKKTVSEDDQYPLAVNRCKHCFHLQLTHVVDPEIIYRNYSYVSGTSQTYHDYMWWFAKWCREYTGKWRGTVLDIGCNDGSQLDYFRNLGYSTHGVDPAENLHKTSTDKGHQVVCGFWNEQSIGNLDNRQFDIVVAQNAFAHNPDPLTYLKLLSPQLKDDGLFFIQTSQADMVRNGEFDTIYHEHVNFYNINSMNELCRRAGMFLIDVVKTPIHGTSYVFIVSNKNAKSEHIKNLIAMENDLLQERTYIQWANTAKQLTDRFLKECEDYRDQGYNLVGYGAAAKGNTLLNYAGVMLDYIIDDNPLKQNTFSPGQNIPVVSSAILEKFTNKDKILFVPLAWNFFSEIKNKITNTRKNDNDRFLKYFPEVQIEH
jgi:2-polyprenyl-3-methyl-5-hydroxy-6-metoxy-1,4-benzoquinol methylase